MKKESGTPADPSSLPEEILTQPGQSIIGKQLLLVQIHHQALKERSILNRRTHPGRKRRPHLFAAAGATLDFGPMLGHHQRGFRQLEHLATLIVEHRLFAQSVPLAVGTNFQPVNANVLGIFDPLQGLTGWPGWPPAPDNSAPLCPGPAAAAPLPSQ